MSSFNKTFDGQRIEGIPSPFHKPEGKWKGTVAKVYDCGCVAYDGRDISGIPDHCPDHSPDHPVTA